MEATLMKYMKYLLEGLAIAAAAYYLPQKNTKLTDVLYIGLVGALTFALLDMFAPSVGSGARLGSGFGIGANHVGFGEGFTNDDEPEVEGFYQDEPDMPNVDNEDELVDGDEPVDGGEPVEGDAQVSDDVVPAVEDEDEDMPDQLADMSDDLSNMSSELANMSDELDGDKFTNYTKEPIGFNLY